MGKQNVKAEKVYSTWFSEWARRKIMAKWRFTGLRALEEEIVSPTTTTCCPGHEQKDSTSTIFKLKSFQTAGEIKDFYSCYPKCLRFEWNVNWCTKNVSWEVRTKRIRIRNFGNSTIPTRPPYCSLGASRTRPDSSTMLSLMEMPKSIAYGSFLKSAFRTCE